MNRDDAADLALVGGIAALVGGVAWLLLPRDAAGASLAYAPAATPQEVAVSQVPMPAFLAAAPPAGAARERYFEAAVDAPTWVRIALSPSVSIDVSSDYVTAQGIRVPLWPSTAQRVADRFGAMLPTKRLVDEIWRHATVKIEPHPMNYRPLAGDDVRVIAQHEAIVDGQIAGRTGLVDGPLKNYIVGRALTTSAARGKQYLYGWHRLNGTPIQPVFGGHSSRFSDYAAGTRLVSRTAYLNGQPVTIESLFANPQYAPLLYDDGTLTPAALRYPTT